MASTIRRSAIFSISLRSTTGTVACGKGLSLASAKVSAIMESIEQWHAEEVDLPARFASFAERRRKGAPVDAWRLPRYRQAFDESARLCWVEARSLDGSAVEVPLGMVQLDLTFPLPPGSSFFPVGSNGLASGNTLCEAIAHGAWELIERDAHALFVRRAPEEQVARRLALDTVDDASALTLLGRYEAAGVAVGVWDMTTDIGLACFMCSIVERELDPFRRIGLARGYGCHADRGVALCRALSEAAQSRLTRITGSRDDIQAPDFDAIRCEGAIRDAQRLIAGATGTRRFDEVPTRHAPTFEDDLAWTEARLESAGVGRLAYVDLWREGGERVAGDEQRLILHDGGERASPLPPCGCVGDGTSALLLTDVHHLVDEFDFPPDQSGIVQCLIGELNALGKLSCAL